MLDDAAALKERDPSGMRDIVFSLPAYLRDASARWPPADAGRQGDQPSGRLDQILVAGMGGSAIGGDLVAALIGPGLKIPFAVWRDYGLPDYAGPQTLVIVSSYSGNTAEALSAYSAGRDRGCRLLAITSGGELAHEATRDGTRTYQLPAGFPPRGALAYSALAIWTALRRLGLVADFADEVPVAATLLDELGRQYGVDHPLEGNPAKQVALKLHGCYPIFYAASHPMAVVAARWRSQLAENAKMLSSHHLLPEMNHNEIVGYQFPEFMLQSVVVVFLRDQRADRRLSHRMDVTGRLLQTRVKEVIHLHSAGEALLARLLSLIFLGDCVSFYSALLNGVDPMPVEMIDTLKGQIPG